MIDTMTERLVSLTRASKLKNLPRRRGRKRPHTATFYRWAKHGIRGIHLETLRVGGTLCTSLEAVQRFFEALSGIEQSRVDQTARADDRVKRASKLLDQEGF